MMGMKKARLSAVALGVALGLMCGVGMLVVGLAATHGVFGADMMARWATMYPGVDVSMKGSLIAGAWGFIKGFFSGLILAWLYNLCLCCCTKGHCGCCKSVCDKCKCEKCECGTNKTM
ncbi:MAG TPA: hypothetical protein VLI69_06620 [Gammaproteobacteria bacterium]|nr:hypothetical protein [Gammaproteobacteria bacterium]